MTQGHVDWATKRDGYFSNVGYSANVENGTQNIYQPAAGYTFYISAFYMTILNASGSVQQAAMIIDNPSPIPTSVLMYLYCDDSATISLAIPLSKEIEVISLAEIQIVSPAANVFVTGGVIGYELA